MMTLFLATFGAVLLAEVAGDKLLYTTGVLSARFRSLPVMLGVALAFMAKMGVAVMVGGAIGRLPHGLITLVTSVSFVGVAYAIWRAPDPKREEPREESSGPKIALVSFATIFFSEWADVGQITAAAMAARYAAPLIVWLGAVSAMLVKGALAASVGAGVRKWVRERVAPRTARFAGSVVMLSLGVVTAIEALWVTP